MQNEYSWSAGGSFPGSDSGSLAPSTLWLFSIHYVNFTVTVLFCITVFSAEGSKPVSDACYFCSPSLDVSDCKGGWEVRYSCVPRRKGKQVGDHLVRFRHRFKGFISAKNRGKNIPDRGKDTRKSLRQERAWHIWGSEIRIGWLKHGERGWSKLREWWRNG